MIQIEFLVDSIDGIQAVEVKGHAEYSEYGEDIVCAAVSSQIISIENSLQMLLDHQVVTDANEREGGYVKITLPTIENAHQQNDAQVLLRHLFLAYEVLAENYPEYIQLKTKKIK